MHVRTHAATPRKSPLTFGVYGRPYADAEVLALGMHYQKSTIAHRQRPPIDKIEPEILNACSATIKGSTARCLLPAAIKAKLGETGIGLPAISIPSYGRRRRV